MVATQVEVNKFAKAAKGFKNMLMKKILGRLLAQILNHFMIFSNFFYLHVWVILCNINISFSFEN